MALLAKRKARDDGPDSAALLNYYRDMLLIRRFEEKAGQLYGMGLIGGFCHLYIGQEAVVVGMQAALEPGDSVITSYRDHGHMLACGMDPKGVMAELTGRAGGYSKGKGGSMHMFSREKNFFGGHGIVGAQVPHRHRPRLRHIATRTTAASASPISATAPSTRARSTKSFNMAALWKLPVVYVIENNKYGMGTSVERASAGTDLHLRGAGLWHSGERSTAWMCWPCAPPREKAVGYVRGGKGPYILEMMTYRYRGHSMSDPAKYRSRGRSREDAPGA